MLPLNICWSLEGHHTRVERISRRYDRGWRQKAGARCRGHYRAVVTQRRRFLHAGTSAQRQKTCIELGCGHDHNVRPSSAKADKPSDNLHFRRGATWEGTCSCMPETWNGSDSPPYKSEKLAKSCTSVATSAEQAELFRVVRKGHPIPEFTCWTSPIVIQPIEKRPIWSNGKKHVFLWKLAPAQGKD